MIKITIFLFLLAQAFIPKLNESAGFTEESSPGGNIIIDSKMTFDEAVKGTKAPKDIIKNMRLIDVRYYSADGKLHSGQLVVHKDAVKDLTEIFKIIEEKKFTVEKVIPIVKYDWDDRKSMTDNNTSSFCYRTISGTNRMSYHAYGKAVDINPRFNPYTMKNGKISPKNGKYDKKRNGTFFDGQYIVEEFKKRGWRWGGNFKSAKDYHHFDKLN